VSKSRLQALRAELQPGKPLDLGQWLQIVGVLDTVLEGYDVRAAHGIAPKAGTPPRTRALQKWLVLHYLALRATEPTEPPKVHRGVVALAWGIPDNRVRKLVDAHADELATTLAGTTPDAVLETVPVLQREYRRLTRNPR